MSAGAITLRTGDARDIAAVEALVAAAFDPRYGEAWTRGQCLGVLAMTGVRLTLATIGEAPAGFALVRSAADEAELLLIAVAPSMRRGGVGGALLRSVIAEAGATGIADLHLEVRASNPAVGLYRDHGFVKVGERRAYYRGRTGEAFDAHTYRRPIGP